MSARREAVDPNPGDFDVLVSVSNNFPHLRFVFRQLGMTEHTFSDGRNAGRIAYIRANMTIDARHTKLHMSVVRERDRLLGDAGGSA